MILRCVMKTCGREIESDAKHCVCVCGNQMYPIAKEPIGKSKKVEKPVQEVNHE